MFLSNNCIDDLNTILEGIGFAKDLSSKKDVLIKINMAKIGMPNYPRTDIELLTRVVKYIRKNGARCAIAEGADGDLTKNLYLSGLEGFLRKHDVKIIDIDLEACDEVISYGERHYIPKCFKEYPLRVAIPVTSKRQDRLYSNNVKLFVGSVPQKFYQLEDPDSSLELFPRPKLHQNIDTSIANLFFAIQDYSRFDYFVNGGVSFNEKQGEFSINETFIGDDAYELDSHMYNKYFSDCEYPKYLDIIKERIAT